MRGQPLVAMADLHLVGHAHGAMQLHGVFTERTPGCGNERLRAGHRAHARDVIGLQRGRGGLRDGAGLLDADEQIDQPVPDHLIGAERAAELLARHHVLPRQGESPRHGANRFGAGHDRGAVDGGLHHRPGRAGRADTGVVRHSYAPQRDRGGLAAVVGG
ncbi:hypothetical protein D3C81_1017390 [compost metagenome]